MIFVISKEVCFLKPEKNSISIPTKWEMIILQTDHKVNIRQDTAEFLLNCTLMNKPEWFTWMRLDLDMLHCAMVDILAVRSDFCVQKCLADGQNTCCSLGSN